MSWELCAYNDDFWFPGPTEEERKDAHQKEILKLNNDLKITLKKMDIEAQIKLKAMELESKERCIMRELELKYGKLNVADIKGKEE